MAEPVAISEARVESLRVRNYRALRDVTLKRLTPLTVLLGPNGSGKSTIFDVFAFLSECYSLGVRSAWERRNRFDQLRTRGATGGIVVEIKYREKPGLPLITYRLELDEGSGGPVITGERLSWNRGGSGRPFDFLRFQNGTGYAASGETPGRDATREEYTLDSPELLAVNALGQFQNHPRVSALRRFIRGWHISYLSTQSGRVSVEAGPQPHLSSTGDNLPNVIQHLAERHPDALSGIFARLAKRIPQLERVEPERMADGRLLLRLKDRPFSEPILAKFASDGTLKMLAYLVLLHEPQPPPFIGIEEPENFLYPRLLRELIEECEIASVRSQLFVTTHSPEILNQLQPAQIWMLRRGDDGYARASRLSDEPGVGAFLLRGAKLGDLWMEGYFVPRRLGGGGRTGEAR
jgi:predicted ATPase